MKRPDVTLSNSISRIQHASCLLLGVILGILTIQGCKNNHDDSVDSDNNDTPIQIVDDSGPQQDTESEQSSDTTTHTAISSDTTIPSDTGTNETTDSVTGEDFETILASTDDDDTSSSDSRPDSGVEFDAGDTDTESYHLIGSPMLFAPTAESFGLTAALTQGDPQGLKLQIRAEGESKWRERIAPSTPTDMENPDVARFDVTGLSAETTYEYQIIAEPTESNTEEALLYESRATTAPKAGATFSFALISDTHIGGDPFYSNQGNPAIMTDIMAQIDAAKPDLLFNLGDMLDFHKYGFNNAPPTETVIRDTYFAYRELLGHTVSYAPHIGIIGNWDGENGCYTDEEIERSRTVRQRYMPGPSTDTYPEGGSAEEDYYAFTWGDALFIVLNVQTYTLTKHLIDTNGGTPEDWTLGEMQLSWLTETLENANSKWRFICIHHAVGGLGGTDGNSAYGRGGGRAANVGEQAIIHQLMIEHGVHAFFYGHDHVFVDMVVDSIHYTMPSSAGAIWLFTQTDTGYDEAWIESGWAKVNVSPDSVLVQFINLEESVLHEYTLE